MTRLTKNEQTILELLWSENRPLTRLEILDLLEQKNTPMVSIHHTIGRLIRKGVAKEAEKIKIGHRWSQTYTHSVTRAEFGAHQVVDNGIMGEEDLLKIALHAFDARKLSDQTLDELQRMIDAHREKRK